MTSLGANLPNPALLARIEKECPDLLALSVSMPFNLRPARTLIAELRTRVPEVAIMIGGQVFQMLPSLAASMGALVEQGAYRCATLTHLNSLPR
ncbi:MAG: cobalamin B12-binding domain-containing protein [Thiohalocapsa sp. PB-PSB1]|nr:MAG: hypothetical protein N838_33915 [Thiohalocapsa sp. PB-PSB1]QQO55866.1 MAG: cobalamin B12-binding domain-containing protein [Thiohalocapsa sp. PB-PSB1]